MMAPITIDYCICFVGADGTRTYRRGSSAGHESVDGGYRWLRESFDRRYGKACWSWWSWETRGFDGQVTGAGSPEMVELC